MTRLQIVRNWSKFIAKKRSDVNEFWFLSKFYVLFAKLYIMR